MISELQGSVVKQRASSRGSRSCEIEALGIDPLIMPFNPISDVELQLFQPLWEPKISWNSGSFVQYHERSHYLWRNHE